MIPEDKKEGGRGQQPWKPRTQQAEFLVDQESICLAPGGVSWGRCICLQEAQNRRPHVTPPTLFYGAPALSKSLGAS